MPGHFSCEYSVDLFHLSLDQRMPGFIHEWLATQTFDFIDQTLGAFYFHYGLDAGITGQQFSPK